MSTGALVAALLSGMAIASAATLLGGVTLWYGVAFLTAVARGGSV